MNHIDITSIMGITVVLDPALSIGDHWAAHSDLLRMLCYAIVVSI